MSNNTPTSTEKNSLESIIQSVPFLDDDIIATEIFAKPATVKQVPPVVASTAHQTMSVQNADQNTQQWSHEINATEKVIEQKVFVKAKQSSHELQALNKEHDLIVIQTVDINDDETFRGVGGIERVVMGKAENIIIQPLKAVVDATVTQAVATTETIINVVEHKIEEVVAPIVIPPVITEKIEAKIEAKIEPIRFIEPIKVTPVQNNFIPEPIIVPTSITTVVPVLTMNNEPSVPQQIQPDFSLFDTVESAEEKSIKQTIANEKKQLSNFSDDMLAKASEPKNLKTIIAALIICGIGFVISSFLAMNYADQANENAKLSAERYGQGSANKSRIVDLQLQLTAKNDDFNRISKEQLILKSEYDTLNEKYIKIVGEAGLAPINIGYKDSKKGGIVMAVKNRDDAPLDVQFYLENATADEKIIVNKAIAPENTVNIGLEDGWIFRKGDKITIKVAGFPDVIKKYGE